MRPPEYFEESQIVVTKELPQRQEEIGIKVVKVFTGEQSVPPSVYEGLQSKLLRVKKSPKISRSTYMSNQEGIIECRRMDSPFADMYKEIQVLRDDMELTLDWTVPCTLPLNNYLTQLNQMEAQLDKVGKDLKDPRIKQIQEMLDVVRNYQKIEGLFSCDECDHQACQYPVNKK